MGLVAATLLGGLPGAHGCPSPNSFSEDDIEAFLETFERVAKAAQCSRDKWPFVLGPYLTGDAQATVKALSKEGAADYDRSKAAILDRYTITPETHRQRFRTMTWQTGEGPQAFTARLKDSATRWLLPRPLDAKEVVDKVALEQLFHVMPPRARHWVACWQPPTLEDAVGLWDNFLVVEGFGGPQEGARAPAPVGGVGPRMSGDCTRPQDSSRVAGRGPVPPGSP